MNILVVSNSFPTKYTPMSGPFVKRIAADLNRLGHCVEVVAPISWVSQIKRGLPKPLDGAAPFPIHAPFYTSLPLSYFSRLKRIFAQANDILCARAIKRTLRRNPQKFDMCYAHFLPGGRAAFRALSGLPIYLAMGESDPWIYDSLYGENWISELHDFAGVITASNSLKDYLIGRNPGLEPIAHSLPNGVDTERFSPLDQNSCRSQLSLPNDETIVAFVGSFDARKGVARVEEACRILGVKGVFLGEGDHVPSPDVALFAGSVDAERVRQYLGAADCFALPSLSEGRSNSVLEALSMGKVCIVSDRDFNTEFLDKHHAVLINPESVQSIADGIKNGLCPQTRKKLEMAARRVALQFDQKKRIAAMAHIFETGIGH